MKLSAFVPKVLSTHEWCSSFGSLGTQLVIEPFLPGGSNHGLQYPKHELPLLVISHSCPLSHPSKLLQTFHSRKSHSNPALTRRKSALSEREVLLCKLLMKSPQMQQSWQMKKNV